jgi:hypothetical protein
MPAIFPMHRCSNQFAVLLRRMDNDMIADLDVFSAITAFILLYFVSAVAVTV